MLRKSERTQMSYLAVIISLIRTLCMVPATYVYIQNYPEMRTPNSLICIMLIIIWQHRPTTLISYTHLFYSLTGIKLDLFWSQ